MPPTMTLSPHVSEFGLWHCQPVDLNSYPYSEHPARLGGVT
jgi:hypothetical protein